MFEPNHRKGEVMGRIRFSSFFTFFSIGLAAFAGACGPAVSPTGTSETGDELRGPGRDATDARTPELGSDLSILRRSQLSLLEGALQAESENGPLIEAKFELDDSGKLSLSLYPAGQPIDVDAERNKFQELSGDPTAIPFNGSLEVFMDQEHLTRSARDLTLVQLSELTVVDAIDLASDVGTVFWAIPTIRREHAGYGVYTWDGRRQHYYFIDGQGSRLRTRYWPIDLGDGPGEAATDKRTPELGNDLSILKTSQITMADALAQAEAEHGDLIEAKFELDDNGKLSLSIYPVGKGLGIDSERNSFFELAGDPTVTPFSGELTEFKVPDVEHLTRSSRDLTLVQTIGMSLRRAVDVAAEQIAGGVVYWAIPTIRGTRAGYGVYVYAPDGSVHYFFIS
jgi:hypothetical protein